MRFDGAQVSVEVLGPWLRVVRMSGVLDDVTAARLAAVAEAQLARCSGHLVIDLGEVRFFGTEDLDALVAVRDAASAADVRLHLAGIAAREEMLPAGITRALAQFSRIPTLEQAERELGGRLAVVADIAGQRGQHSRPRPPAGVDEESRAVHRGPLRSA